MAILNSKVSGTSVTFTVTIEKTDPTPNWEVLVSSKTDRGLGQTGRDPLCNFYVEDFRGVGSSTVVKYYTPDYYCAGLALQYIGQVDYTIFTVLPAPPNAQIFNWCWGETGKLGSSCPIPSLFPAIKAGTIIDIKADIANSGTTGSIMVNFEIDGIVKYTDTNISLATYPGGGLWSPTYSGFVMPTKNVILSIKAYNWNGTTWVLASTQTKTSTISTISAGCSYVDLAPFTSPLGMKVGDKLDMVTAVSPGNVPFTVTFKDRQNTILGTCKTSGTGMATGSSSCPFTWDSSASYAGKAGTYYVKAYTNGCSSTESVIVVDAPILQYNLSITVKDSVSGIALQGATVLVATIGGASQSKLTDANGLVTFRMDSGTISISISKNGYNTFSTTESLYSDKTITYQLVSTPPIPTVGDIQFVSVPVGADILIDGKSITGSPKTPATVTGIPAGNHTWTLKLTGYNDSNGSIIVPSGGSTSVYATLTPVTPTSGSLNITSTPMGASITIDGKDTGQTTSGMTVITNVTPGIHTLVLTMIGYKDYTATFSITIGQTTYLNPVLTPLTTTGTLEVTSEPSGARIYIDDADTQRVTPGTILNIIEGDHRYKIILGGYKDIVGIVTIIAGQTEKINLILEKAGPGLEVLAGVAIAGVAILSYISGKKE